MSTRGKRRDRNHAEVREAFRALGWYVHDTADLGGGFPDLVIAKCGQLLLVEVKDGTLKPSAQALTLDEATVALAFHAADCEVCVVRDLDDVTALNRWNAARSLTP